MYKSPINLYETAMETIIEQRENAIFAKVQDAFDVQVDKAELIRALQYDLDQYYKGYADGKADAAQKWIPVSERLPEKRETVLVCDARENYMNAWEYLGRDEWLWDSSIWRTEAITHWMPLPEPPKEDIK